MGATESKTEDVDSNSPIKDSSMLRDDSESVDCVLMDHKSISHGASGAVATMHQDSEEVRTPDRKYKAVVDNSMDDQENSLDGQSLLSKTCVKLEHVDESLMRAIIIKYFTQPKSNSDNPLPENCDQLLLKGSEETDRDFSKEESSSRFSQLCASNFIRLGPSLIGYPAVSWFQNGYSEGPAQFEESSDEQEGTEPNTLQIWITEKSHPTSHDLKNDVFLKMCVVEEINRGDLMEHRRAYLDIDGNIEYFSNAATQKEGISDFVDHFERTGSFEFNQKEYSASWKSIIRALSQTPQCVNSLRDSKHKFQYRCKLEENDLKKYPVSDENGLEDVTVEIKVSRDESSNKMSKSDVSDCTDLSIADSSYGTKGNLNNVKTGVEVPGNTPCVDLVPGLSELSIEDTGSKCHLGETHQDSSSTESMLRDSPFVRRLIDDLVKTAERNVLNVLDESEFSRKTSKVDEESSDEESSDDSSSSNDSSDSSLSSKSSSEIVLEGDGKPESSIRWDMYVPPGQKTTQGKLRYLEESRKVAERSLEVSERYGLRETGLRVLDPRECDVISKLYTPLKTYWRKKKNSKPINVVKSSDEVASSLMKALEITSSKNKGKKKGTKSPGDIQNKPKGVKNGAESARSTSTTSKSPTMNVESANTGSSIKLNEPINKAESLQGTSTKPNGPTKDPSSKSPTKVVNSSPSSASSNPKSPNEEVKNLSSSGSLQSEETKIVAGLNKSQSAESAVKRQWYPRKRGKKKGKRSTNDDSTKSPPSSNLQKIGNLPLPSKVGENPSKSVAGISGKLSHGHDKVLDEEVVIDLIPRAPYAPFGRHSVADRTSQSDLISALKLQPVTSAASMQGRRDVIAPGSNLPVATGPSTFMTPGPPMGTIPVPASVPLAATSSSTSQDARPPSTPQNVRGQNVPASVPVAATSSSTSQDARPLSALQNVRGSGVKLVDQHYLTHPEEFGRLVVQSMESMTLEQRTHAINIIRDVLIEGNNNALCQFTRLSGIRNNPESGKQVFRMGPSHVSDTLQNGNPGVLTGKSSMSYGFPQSAGGVAVQNACPSNSSRGFEGATKTQSLPPQEQSTIHNVTLNLIGVPPTQKERLPAQGEQKVSPKKKKTKAQQGLLPVTNIKGQQNEKSEIASKQPSTDKKTRTRKFYPSRKPPKKEHRNASGTEAKLAPKAANHVSVGAKLTQAQNSQGAQNSLSTTQNAAIPSYWALKKKRQKLNKALSNNNS